MGSGFAIALLFQEALALKPEVTLVVEWANVRLAGASRAQAMLRALGREVRASARRLEVLFCHEAGASVSLPLGEYGFPPCWRIVEAPSGDYYELKNYGARAAQGDLVVFLDSDVIPEPGWLEALVAPFGDPAVACVAGQAYIDPVDWYARAFALFWLFPMRSAGSGLRCASRFWANNAAFRRSVFLDHPFPRIAGSSRGACLALAGALGLAGIRIWEAREARVSHPAPQKGRHFVWRALAHGRDRVVRACGWSKTPMMSVLLFAACTARGWARILLLGWRVGLPPWGAPYAACLCAAYFGLRLAGELAAFLRVPALRRVEL